MKRTTLMRWLQVSYRRFKECSGLPAWLVPSRSFDRLSDELGDEAILEMSRPFHLADGVENFAEQTSSPDAVPDEVWQEAITSWPPLSQVKQFVEAFFQASETIMKHYESVQGTIGPEVICRSMAALGFAPFVSEGKALLEAVATILGGRGDQPAELLTRYANTVIQGDIETVRRIDSCIVSDDSWTEWTGVFLEKAQSCQYTPQLIGVTPPISAELVRILTEMVKEVNNDESR
ncbi:MAG: hypothetical protein ACLFPU_04095 [Dehalococcoidia bacterium]